MRSFRYRILVPIGLALTFTSSTASAEVFCSTSQFRISGYVYGMPAVENIVLTNGSPMQSVSLCGDVCTDTGTQARVSIALTAKALSRPLIMYFATETSCSQIASYSKPYAVSVE